MLDASCWLQAAACWLLAAGCWLLTAGLLLDAGCWLAAAGCWLRAARVAYSLSLSLFFRRGRRRNIMYSAWFSLTKSVYLQGETPAFFVSSAFCVLSASCPLAVSWDPFGGILLSNLGRFGGNFDVISSSWSLWGPFWTPRGGFLGPFLLIVPGRFWTSIVRRFFDFGCPLGRQGAPKRAPRRPTAAKMARHLRYWGALGVTLGTPCCLLLEM